jgi:hypothetical protein
MGRSLDPRGQRGGVNVVVVVVVLALVGAAVAAAYTFMGKQEVDGAQTAIGQVGKADDASAEVTLTSALTGAQSWWAENATMEGYGPTPAAAFEPDIAFDASSTAEAQHVSIRGADATSVVLVTLGGTGPLCVGLTNGVVSYGRVDASSAAQCVGTSWS